jgi:hypothetical protein
MIDSLDQAIYDTIHGYKGGAVSLAPRVGMNPGTLNNKAYPGHDAQLTLRESIPIQREARDFKILHTYASCLDHAVIPLGDYSRTTDLELLDLYARYHAELGQTAQAIRECLAGEGGRITRRDVRQVRRELIEDNQAGLEVLARLEGIAEDDPDE